MRLFNKDPLIKMCGWALNCRAYTIETYTCNNVSEEERSKYCGAYRNLTLDGSKSRHYKERRLKQRIDDNDI